MHNELSGLILAVAAISSGITVLNIQNVSPWAQALTYAAIGLGILTIASFIITRIIRTFIK